MKNICQQCRDDYCLNKKNGKCFKNYEINDLDEIVYYKCLNTNDEGTECIECLDNFKVSENGLCKNLNDCEIDENGNCNKCKVKDYEDNLLCANKYYGCVETSTENCLRCDDLEYLNICTECVDGYILDYNDNCVKNN